MSWTLSERMEKIESEMQDKEGTLIVQMKGNDDQFEKVFEDAVEQINRRRSVVSARELLSEIPPFDDTVARGRSRRPQGAAVKNPLKGGSGINEFAEEAWSVARVRKSATSLLQPLLDSDWVKELTAKDKTRRKSRDAKSNSDLTIPIHFFTSSAIALRVSKDQLLTVQKHLSSLPVADIFVNRVVKVPPVAKAKGALPPEVEDNKAYTWGLAKTGAMACWGAFGVRGKGVKVAVLDTGFDAKHPDLKDKLAGFAEFDENGQLVTDHLANARDTDSHGTHCSATIVGENVSGRHIGIAPDAKIMSAVVLPGGAGTDLQILAGIDWAVMNGAHIISMSLGGLRMTPDVMDTYTKAIINANRMGVPVVVAVGNEGSQTSGAPGNDYFAFTVGATDSEDRAAGFSGGRTQIIEQSRYIPEDNLPFVYSKPDITAPGVNIYSAVPGKKWEAWNGTSMATPHVAGALALLLCGSPKLQNLAGGERTRLLQNLLVSTVKELGESGQNHRYGYGRIDVLRALGHAQSLGYIDS